MLTFRNNFRQRIQVSTQCMVCQDHTGIVLVGVAVTAAPSGSPVAARLTEYVSIPRKPAGSVVVYQCISESLMVVDVTCPL